MAPGQNSKIWYEEEWSRGIVLGIMPDPNSGYRAIVWFEYTRALFNEIREGSLIAVRNFSDRPRKSDGVPEGEREASYEEFSVLQIDQIHPWHYAIQDSGDRGFPGFITAAAESARRDWTDMDQINRDDVSRIRCEAIPTRLAFRPETDGTQLPNCFFDRSMPMPGYEAYLLTSDMTSRILNQDLDTDICLELGRHVVQHDVNILVQLPELLRLHFGIFGYTGAGKSNLVSTLTRKALARSRSTDGNAVYKIVIFDLMDEYTGLLIDQLVLHPYSRLIVAGRKALPQAVLEAAEAVASKSTQADELASRASKDWAKRIILPRELARYRELFQEPLRRLIVDNKVKFYEKREEQGVNFEFDIDDLINNMGRAYGNQQETNEKTSRLRSDLNGLVESIRSKAPEHRSPIINELIQRLSAERQAVTTQKARQIIDNAINQLRQQGSARGELGSVGVFPKGIEQLLNFQPTTTSQAYEPSLTVVIGENGERIADFGNQLVENVFDSRRTRSLIYPTVSFIFDEADVFIAGGGEGRSVDKSLTMVDSAMQLARRGRKFGLGLGIATQRIRYLNTSIMAQPHTYFISRLPRKTDREAIAEAFAISDETLEQTFSFSTGQWLVASHDATGLKGTPFPVQVENANTRILEWLKSFSSQ